jgi:subtilisin family serine protease
MNNKIKNNAIIFLLSFLFSFNLYSQKDFYYYRNEKIEFKIDFQYLLIKTNQNFEISKLNSLISNNFEVISSKKSSFSQEIVLKFSTTFDTILYQKYLDILYEEANVYYVTYGLFYENGNRVVYFSNVINVCLKENQSFEELEILKKEYNINSIKQNELMKSWYSLSVDKKSKLNSSELCKLLTIQKSFKHSEPEIINGFQNTCVNDTYFNNQWYLNNTGQSSGSVGVDIKVCNAWNVTTGNEEVITAVIDQGVDLTHPDLIDNIYPISYDATSNSTTSFTWDWHGTACAGIIAASSNNAIGISGVAPNSQIMSISSSFDLDTNLALSLANSINFAVEKNADIISNSWEGPPSSAITAAISNALLNGRNGLGCVVVFSSGNSNTSNSTYPGNSNPQIINVGAVDRCGIRSGRIDIISTSCDPWSSGSSAGSSYGSTLDIVAGGSSIYTTDIQGTGGYTGNNYNSNFGGTSAACPQVAGVAGLILSVNPCLTQQVVHDIICFSGQKLSNYTFTPQTGTSRESLGSWNNEVGHGLVDANVCVNLAKELYIQFQTISASEDFNFSDILMGSNVTSYKQTGNAVINNNAVSTITAKNSITLKKGTLISRGPNVLLKINPDLACNYSNPIKMSSMSSEMANFNESPEIEQNLSIQKFNFYPNPTNETLNIKINNKLSEKVKIEIYNVSGKMLFSNYLNFSENLTHSLNLNENNLNDSGIYFIKVSNSTFSDSYKIIKL